MYKQVYTPELKCQLELLLIPPGGRGSGPVRLPDRAGPLRSQQAANVANGVVRRSSTILVNRVCIQAEVELDSLIRVIGSASWSAAMLSQRSSTSLMRSSTVNCCNFVSMVGASFFGIPIKYAAAVRMPRCIPAGFLELGCAAQVCQPALRIGITSAPFLSLSRYSAQACIIFRRSARCAVRL